MDAPTWPCLITKDFGTPACEDADSVVTPFRCVLFFLRRPMVGRRWLNLDDRKFLVSTWQPKKAITANKFICQLEWNRASRVLSDGVLTERRHILTLRLTSGRWAGTGSNIYFKDCS